MLLACSSCHRQYDVGDLPPGRRVRCACGVLNRVPRRKPRQREMAHCGNCGAELPEGGKRCEHCEARVTLAEEGFGKACPQCFALLGKKARFCSACGLAIVPAGRVQVLTKSTCPRCDEPLSVVQGKADPFHQCTTCGGIWLSRRAFERVMERAVERGASPDERRQVARDVGTRRHERRKHVSIRCPVCQGVLRELEYAIYSGVLVDECLAHGWWFDAGELESLERFLRGGGLGEVEKRRKAHSHSRRTAAAWRRRCEEEARQEGLIWLLLGFLS